MNGFIVKAKWLLIIVVLLALGYFAAFLVSGYGTIDKQNGSILSNYAKDNQKRRMMKLEGYFEIYERHFSRFRNTDVNVLEIGVGEGGSLQMWKAYFGPKANIFGIDINPASKVVEESQIRVFIGDQADRAFLSNFKNEVPKLDIVIDDGGHTMQQQKTSFEELFPHVSQNGVYLVEDLVTSYWSEYGGGYRKDGTFIEFAKSIVDDSNAWDARDAAHQITDVTRSLYSLHFYNAVAVFEKRKVSADKIIVSGKIPLR